MKRATLHSPEGLWLVDKPVGISSFGVVARLRRLTGIRKVGHAGTLDPLASGLMLVLAGKDFTRQADTLLKLDKSYFVEIKLGETSTTDDMEGDKLTISDRKPTLQEIKTAITELTGEIIQTPPIFSAIKVGGKRAYKMARSGQTPEMPAREVTVGGWHDIEYQYPYLRATIDVSSGTYIRSLARSLGDAVGTGGYITALRRLTVGPYLLEDAVALDKLTDI